MKVLNKTIRFFGYVGIYAVTFLQCYMLSLLATGSLLSITLAIISFVTSIPEVIRERFWLVYILLAVPLAIIFFIIVVSDVLADNPLKVQGFKKAL